MRDELLCKALSRKVNSVGCTISHTQKAFIGRRHILDVLIVHEVIVSRIG